MAAAGPRGRGGRAPAAAALRLALLLGAALGSARAAVYFQEQFLDRGWVYKLVETLIFMLSPHVLNHLVTKGRLVLQYTVKHEQEIDCGGGYVKIFSSDLDQKNRSGESHYCLMFGPDICGSETKKVHVILNCKNKPHPIKKVIRCKGEWKPRQIDNPNYRGVWPHPQIDNSNYSPGFSIYSYENIGIIGLDMWQVRAGTIFDNFLITDDEVYAENFGNETWRRTEGPEKEMNIKQTEEEQETERVTEEKYFEQQFKEKLERKKESGKDRAVRNTIKKEEL